MKTISDVAKGSGHWDIRFDDNSVERVQDDDFPEGYTPAVGHAVIEPMQKGVSRWVGDAPVAHAAPAKKTKAKAGKKGDAQ